MTEFEKEVRRLAAADGLVVSGGEMNNVDATILILRAEDTNRCAACSASGLELVQNDQDGKKHLAKTRYMIARSMLMLGTPT